MKLTPLIGKVTLSRELTHDLSGVGSFMSEMLGRIEPSELFKNEFEEFEKSGSKLKLHTFPVLYNDFESHFDGKEKLLQEARMRFRVSFPYLSSLQEVSVFFIPPDKQPCIITCFFLNGVLTRVFDVQGKSPTLVNMYQQVSDYYQACRQNESSSQGWDPDIEVASMPTELFNMLIPNLGKEPVLNLYQRIFGKLSTKYSSLPSFHFLQNSIEKFFTS